jgi:hypothetical protein
MIVGPNYVSGKKCQTGCCSLYCTMLGSFSTVTITDTFYFIFVCFDSALPLLYADQRR